MFKKIFIITFLSVGFIHAGKGGSITTGRDARVSLLGHVNAPQEPMPAQGQDPVEFAAYGDVDHANKSDCLQLGTIVTVVAVGFPALLWSIAQGQ